MSEFADVFWIVCPRSRQSVPGYSDWFLMDLYQVKHIISKRLFTVHLNLHGFINLSVLNIGSLIYPYNYWFIPIIFRVSHYGINNSFNLKQYFKTPFSEIGSQIWENWLDIKMLILFLETMKSNHCYHNASHQIWNSYMVSD